MPSVLVLYSSPFGHTRRIARHLARRLSEHDLDVDLYDLRREPAVPPGGHDAVLVCGAVHYRKLGRELERYVRQHRLALAERPNALVAVSMSIAAPAAAGQRGQAAEDVESFIARSGFAPRRIELLAGELAYRRYNLIVRHVMRNIAGKSGLPTDTSRDHDFTDWGRVEQLGADLFPELRTHPGAPAGASPS